MGRKLTDINDEVITYTYDTKKLREEVGERIKLERINKGETQREFWEHVDLKKDNYIKLEKGEAELKLESLYKISKYCGCEISYLLGDIPNRTHEATDICKATRLSEEAVSILTSDAGYMNKPRAEVINFLIKDSSRYASLLYNIVACYGDKKNIEEDKKSKWFPLMEKLIRNDSLLDLLDRDYALTPSQITEDIVESMERVIRLRLSLEGYSEEEIEAIYEETNEFFSDYRQRTAEEELIKGMLYNQASRYIEKYLF